MALSPPSPAGEAGWIADRLDPYGAGVTLDGAAGFET